ncbi:hypothetical protein FA13DRAFT_1803905 [Coprinellus micaceus]|uniref:Uncharacterized protein n=1 Tax=Coprinellus micaceus TaxID=71717 RepID=A0A4Y7SAT6_COPMI|nr:hypothetical protein FA13DRAFT_1803905 [Coprinellus micaceus]
MFIQVARIWPSRLSLAKILFLTNRYLVEALILYPRPANMGFMSVPGAPSNPVIRVYEALIIHLPVPRMYVSGSQIGITRYIVLAITYFFFFGGTVTLVGLVIKDYVGEDVLIDQTLSALPGCYATSVPSIIAGFWIGPLIVETVLFAIVISRAFVWWRDGTPTPRILTMLATDSTVYFAVIFAMLLANYLMFRYGPPFLSSLLVTPSTTAGCVIASQMFLRMRSMMEYDPEEVVMKAYNAQIHTQPILTLSRIRISILTHDIEEKV